MNQSFVVLCGKRGRKLINSLHPIRCCVAFLSQYWNNLGMYSSSKRTVSKAREKVFLMEKWIDRLTRDDLISFSSRSRKGEKRRKNVRGKINKAEIWKESGSLKFNAEISQPCLQVTREESDFQDSSSLSCSRMRLTRKENFLRGEKREVSSSFFKK